MEAAAAAAAAWLSSARTDRVAVGSFAKAGFAMRTTFTPHVSRLACLRTLSGPWRDQPT
jgi:hypothetical protein